MKLCEELINKSLVPKAPVIIKVISCRLIVTWCEISALEPKFLKVPLRTLEAICGEVSPGSVDEWTFMGMDVFWPPHESFSRCLRDQRVPRVCSALTKTCVCVCVTVMKWGVLCSFKALELRVLIYYSLPSLTFYSVSVPASATLLIRAVCWF